ncbi:hypothetical protein PAAL109150_20595 [Paenibacillus alkaliterrae]
MVFLKHTLDLLTISLNEKAGIRSFTQHFHYMVVFI